MPSTLSHSGVLETAATRHVAAVSDLPQFFRRIAQYRGEFLVYDDGFRGWSYSYPEFAGLVRALTARLRSAGIRKGDAAMIWSESRPGWVIALWACLLEGVIVVPVEPQSSIDLFRRIEEKVRPRLLLLGDRVPSVIPPAQIPSWRVSEIEHAPLRASFEPATLTADDLAEIVFTSGTTGDPKGVIITHRNLAAQISPIDRQFAPYRKYVRPFAPLPVLNLLPMSHLFGQALAMFVAPLIPAPAVFISSASPHEIVRQIRSRRVAILASVPKVLEALRGLIVHRFPEAADTSGVDQPWPLRWWRFRAVHRMFGWKLACVVSGGASLSADLERFWANLGFVVVQGYGLTETAPVISFSHPFHVHRGTTGQPLEGVDLKIAEDGEVLVRGPNVTPGYFSDPQRTAQAFRDGWFHTGDLGELDSGGYLTIRGRKKDMIVTPEGLNVFPEDVEAALNRVPGVRDSAVIGADHVHAVLLLDPGANAEEVLRQANTALESHQKIRQVSIWEGPELPRTAITRKLKRAAIASAIARTPVAKERPEAAQTPEDDIAAVIAKYAPGRVIRPDTTMEELGLSSLDRVELMMDLESKLGTSIDERAFASATTVADLAALPQTAAEESSFPSYNRSWIAKCVRAAAQEAILLPFAEAFARCTVAGLENLRALQGPVIFAANHQSHFDTPVILASLPWRWRRRIAPAMWKEYFDARFHPERHSLRKRWSGSLLYGLIALFFNGFPVPQTEAGARESIRYMGELAEDGWSILIFPEGERTLTGDIGRFLPGVGMIASRLQVPVVPIRLAGVGRVLPVDARWPRRAPVEVKIGAPIFLKGDAYADLARQVEEAVRGL